MDFIVFPGQGAQKIGMGKNLSENFSEAKEVFDEVNDALNFNLTNPYIYGALGSFISGFLFQKLLVTILFGMLTFFIFKVLLSIWFKGISASIYLMWI